MMPIYELCMEWYDFMSSLCAVRITVSQGVRHVCLCAAEATGSTVLVLGTRTLARDGLPQSSRVSLYTLDASLGRSEHTGVTISLPPVASPWSHILRAHDDRTRRNPVIFALDARFAIA
eukprot:6865727-Prymnesium_polylepis.1